MEIEKSSVPEIRKTKIIKVTAHGTTHILDDVACEEPLEIKLNYLKKKKRVERTFTVTMRTPGDDRLLALGLLFSEGIIGSISQVQSIDTDKNTLTVTLDDACRFSENVLKRNLYSASGCGVCGKATLKALNMDNCKSFFGNNIKVSAETIILLEETLHDKQEIFSSTGGLHACALYSADGTPGFIKEDIGRHNALDKLVGEQLSCSELPLSDSIVMLSGRVGYEMIQKSVRAGIPIVAAIGAPSSLAIEIADHFGQTLLGFLRKETFNVYTHPERIVDLPKRME